MKLNCLDSGLADCVSPTLPTRARSTIRRLCRFFVLGLAVTFLLACSVQNSKGEDTWHSLRRYPPGEFVSWDGAWSWNHGQVHLVVTHDGSQETEIFVTQFDASGNVLSQSHTTGYEGALDFNVDPNAKRLEVTAKMPLQTGETSHRAEHHDIQL